MGFSLGKTLGGAVAGFATGGFAGGVIGAGMGALDAYQDKAAYKWQQKQNIKLWNMQNEYNSPKAQMQRYIDAGLNPNLIYSQQNTAGDISGSTLGNSDTMGSANSLLNSKTGRLVQHQQLLNMETSRQQADAQRVSILNSVENANKMLPYQLDLLKAQAEQIRLNQDTPEWLSKFVGRRNANSVSSNGPVSWLRQQGENLGDWIFNVTH